MVWWLRDLFIPSFGFCVWTRCCTYMLNFQPFGGPKRDRLLYLFAVTAGLIMAMPAVHLRRRQGNCWHRGLQLLRCPNRFQLSTNFPAIENVLQCGHHCVNLLLQIWKETQLRPGIWNDSQFFLQSERTLSRSFEAYLYLASVPFLSDNVILQTPCCVPSLAFGGLTQRGGVGFGWIPRRRQHIFRTRTESWPIFESNSTVSLLSSTDGSTVQEYRPVPARRLVFCHSSFSLILKCKTSAENLRSPFGTVWRAWTSVKSASYTDNIMIVPKVNYFCPASRFNPSFDTIWNNITNPYRCNIS